jgi:hypothetical protein
MQAGASATRKGFLGGHPHGRSVRISRRLSVQAAGQAQLGSLQGRCQQSVQLSAHRSADYQEGQTHRAVIGPSPCKLTIEGHLRVLRSLGDKTLEPAASAQLAHCCEPAWPNTVVEILDRRGHRFRHRADWKTIRYRRSALVTLTLALAPNHHCFRAHLLRFGGYDRWPFWPR